MKKVLITRPIPQEVLEKFQGRLEFELAPSGALTKEEALKILPGYDALMVVGFRVDSDVIDAGTNLKAIGNNGVGYDNIDWEYATAKKVAVINTPHEVMHPTAELTVALMLGITRRLAFYDKKIRTGVPTNQMNTSFPTGSMSVYGKTVGIIGFGRIGRAFAAKCKGLGMNVIYNDVIHAPESVETELDAKFMPFDEVLKNADVVSVHCPYIPENHHLIDARALSLMKPTAYFLNAARGKVMDEAALIEALKANTIAGAGLDVYEDEPIVSPGLFELDNVIMTPHVGTGTYEVRVRMVTEALTGIAEVLEGKVPYNVVNPEIYK